MTRPKRKKDKDRYGAEFSVRFSILSLNRHKQLLNRERHLKDHQGLVMKRMKACIIKQKILTPEGPTSSLCLYLRFAAEMHKKCMWFRINSRECQGNGCTIMLGIVDKHENDFQLWIWSFVPEKVRNTEINCTAGKRWDKMIVCFDKKLGRWCHNWGLFLPFQKTVTLFS